MHVLQCHLLLFLLLALCNKHLIPPSSWECMGGSVPYPQVCCCLTTRSAFSSYPRIFLYVVCSMNSWTPYLHHGLTHRLIFVWDTTLRNQKLLKLTFIFSVRLYIKWKPFIHKLQFLWPTLEHVTIQQTALELQKSPVKRIKLHLYVNFKNQPPTPPSQTPSVQAYSPAMEQDKITFSKHSKTYIVILHTCPFFSASIIFSAPLWKSSFD